MYMTKYTFNPAIGAELLVIHREACRLSFSWNAKERTRKQASI
jgi:hypothetical protein